MWLPIDVMTFGLVTANLIFLMIGVGFGISLELAGFGDSRRLAAQFYFKDMTVLKTMFTAIVVACLLLFLSAALGLLDFSEIAVNQTYLWPGIVGGLIMGVGFVIGGYCPGTSVISASSLKIDGMVFFLGTAIGAGVFGESVSSFSGFWNSSYSERLLLSDWLQWSIGATVFGVTVLALAMFYAAEKTEEYVRKRGTGTPVSWKIKNKKYHLGAAALLGTAFAIWTIGQPDVARRWELLKNRYEPLLTSRDVYIHPLEYIKTWNDSAIKLITIDLRSKEEFEKFHIFDAQYAQVDELKTSEFTAPLLQLSGNGVVVLISESEQSAEQGWKWLKAQGVKNLYILDGGLKDWPLLFSSLKVAPHESLDLAKPPLKILDKFPKDTFTPKIKLQTTKRSGGLCG